MEASRNIFILFIISFFSCSPDKEIGITDYKIKNVVVVLIDGARYSETYGDPFHILIPNQMSVAKQGVACTGFYNDGVTNTYNGHVGILTGVYENLDNTGLQHPTYPTLFQEFLKQTGNDSTKAWIVSSKDKLAAINSCIDSMYCYRYKPSTDCGVNGIFSGYRDDSITYHRALNVLKKNHPNLVLISFKEPDVAGHSNNWPGYINGIKMTDYYTGKIFEYLESSPFYKNSTALFITNDHGRHLNGIADGFVSHGDGCEGCRHINLFAYGPCFKTNFVSNNHYNQTDLATTIAYLMHFDLPYSHGQVMVKLLK